MNCFRGQSENKFWRLEQAVIIVICLYWLGVTRAWTDLFKAHRGAKVDRCVVETNKLIIRLDKLTGPDVPSDTSKRKGSVLLNLNFVNQTFWYTSSISMISYFKFHLLTDWMKYFICVETHVLVYLYISVINTHMLNVSIIRLINVFPHFNMHSFVALLDMPSFIVLLSAYEKAIVPWMPDGHAKECPFCKRSFTLTRRRHHCRLCGDIMCDKCSQFLTHSFASKLTIYTCMILNDYVHV